MESTFSHFSDDMKLVGGVVDNLMSRAAVQRYLSTLEEWANGNLSQFSKGKCKDLHHISRMGWHGLALTG